MHISNITGTKTVVQTQAPTYEDTKQSNVARWSEDKEGGQG